MTRKSHKVLRPPGTKFVKVKCPDCASEQVTFTRVVIRVHCQVCGATLLEPTGGLSDVKGEFVSELG